MARKKTQAPTTHDMGDKAQQDQLTDWDRMAPWVENSAVLTMSGWKNSTIWLSRPKAACLRLDGGWMPPTGHWMA